MILLRTRGVCPVCRVGVRVREDGTSAGHARRVPDAAVVEYCPGSHKPVATPATEKDLHQAQDAALSAVQGLWEWWTTSECSEDLPAPVLRVLGAAEELAKVVEEVLDDD